MESKITPENVPITAKAHQIPMKNQFKCLNTESDEPQQAILAGESSKQYHEAKLEEQGIKEEVQKFGCKFCDRKFSNKQALGGHQNAHKQERSQEKNAHKAMFDQEYLNLQFLNFATTLNSSMINNPCYTSLDTFTRIFQPNQGLARPTNPCYQSVTPSVRTINWSANGPRMPSGIVSFNGDNFVASTRISSVVGSRFASEDQIGNDDNCRTKELDNQQHECALDLSLKL